MKSFSTGLKSITMSLEKCEIFLTMENEEVGEMMKHLLGYAINGTEATFRNKWQKIVYDTFASDVKRQIVSSESRRSKCSVSVGSGGKGRSSRKNGGKSEKMTHAMLSEVEDGNLHEPVSNEVITGDLASMDISEKNEVGNDDLSFEAFCSLYEKKDTGSFDTESAWNTLSDDDKRDALDYIRNNLVGKVHSFRWDYPHRFLACKPWKG